MRNNTQIVTSWQLSLCYLAYDKHNHYVHIWFVVICRYIYGADALRPINLYGPCWFNSLRTRNTTSRQRTIPSWASYQIRKIAGSACAGNAGKVFPRRRFQRKPLVSDPGMHHGTCVTHVPWCMSGSLTCGDGENVPGIPRACAPAILRIWQEAHWFWQ